MSQQILQFLGIGAAECIPSPFCRCSICENARQVRGREIRSRSSFRVTADVQIDLNADTFYQAAFLGNDLYALKHLLISHTHEDHFSPLELMHRQMAVERGDDPLNVYLAGEADRLIGAVDRMLGGGGLTGALAGLVEFHRLDFHAPHRVGDITTTPLRGAHSGHFESNSALHFMKLPDGKTLLYALDTGYLPEETFEWLTGRAIEYLIIEGTYGSAQRGERPSGHLDVHGLDQVFNRLHKSGALTGDSRAFITHINHKHDLTHEKYAAYYRDHRYPFSVTVAYDGLKIT